MNNVPKNSPRAWVLAARPKTLMGAAVPMMLALSLAASHGRGLSWVPAMLCVAFAMLMQIDANFVNDYFDGIRGNDAEGRLGPRRACAQGWVSLSAMRRAIALTTILACLVGLPLVIYGGMAMIAVGAACVLFCFLYTTWLSYHALGDVLVLVFFGLVPVCLTYYLQQHSIGWQVVVVSLACGIVIDTLLIINNYRDIDGDRSDGKLTLAVIIGPRATRHMYLATGWMATLMLVPVLQIWSPLMLPYLQMHTLTYREMCAIDHGKQLNKILGKTSRNMFVFGLLASTGILLQ